MTALPIRPNLYCPCMNFLDHHMTMSQSCCVAVQRQSRSEPFGRGVGMSTLQTLSRGCCLLVVVTGMARGAPAQAEEASAASESPTPPVEARPARRPGERLEEMIVSARKREENLQQTPLSVSAFSAIA